MLELQIPATEGFDEANQMFVNIPAQKLQLEHSLVSLSKWESKWCKPFLDAESERTREESLDYIKCMTINSKQVDPRVYKYLTEDQIKTIVDYIQAPMTATWFGAKDAPNTPNKPKRSIGGRIVTSELIYYYMISLQIPVEFEKWHLKRLMTLIEVCNEENKPKEKQSRSAMLSQRAALNRARRAKYNTKG